MKLAILHSPTTPLWLLVAMENWVESKISLKEYVKLTSHFPLIYTDKSPSNSFYALLGEVGVWELVQSARNANAQK